METARVLVATTNKGLVVPMTLVHEGNYRTIREGFETICPVRHFALVASRGTLARRLTQRGEEPWAFAQIDRCLAALDGPEFAVHLDAERSVRELTDDVLRLL